MRLYVPDALGAELRMNGLSKMEASSDPTHRSVRARWASKYWLCHAYFWVHKFLIHSCSEKLRHLCYSSEPSQLHTSRRQRTCLSPVLCCLGCCTLVWIHDGFEIKKAGLIKELQVSHSAWVVQGSLFRSSGQAWTWTVTQTHAESNLF